MNVSHQIKHTIKHIKHIQMSICRLLVYFYANIQATNLQTTGCLGVTVIQPLEPRLVTLLKKRLPKRP